MIFRTQKEAAGYIASRLAGKRENPVTVYLASREADTRPLFGLIFEADPRLLFCVENLKMRECGWKNKKSVIVSAEFTKIMPSSVIRLASAAAIEDSAYQAVLFHRRELRMVLPGKLMEAAEEKINSLLESYRFLNCGLQKIQVERKETNGCSFCAVSVRFWYSYSYQEMRRRLPQTEAAVSRIAHMARRAGKEDWRQAYAVVRYCTVNWQYGSLPDSQGDEFTAYGALVNRKAVCMGISLAVCEIFAKLGIPCRYVHGTREGVGHAWNMVYIKGGWFYIDVTDAIGSQNPLYGWGMTELRDRTIDNPGPERLQCSCDKAFLRREGLTGPVFRSGQQELFEKSG